MFHTIWRIFRFWSKSSRTPNQAPLLPAGSTPCFQAFWVFLLFFFWKGWLPRQRPQERLGSKAPPSPTPRPICLLLGICQFPPAWAHCTTAMCKCQNTEEIVSSCAQWNVFFNVLETNNHRSVVKGLNGPPGRYVGFLMRSYPRWWRGPFRPKAQAAPLKIQYGRGAIQALGPGGPPSKYILDFL